MNKLNFFAIFMLCLLPFSLFAQRSVNGRITDADGGAPIFGASVFFDNTTVGTTTDIDGNYRLIVPGEGSYQLTISHVGYQTIFKNIEPESRNIVFDAVLHSNQLEELTISQRVRVRQADVNLFWNTILGKNPSRRTIQATNPETAFFYYNPETRILRVTCREPLQIVNNETGYHIQYVLNHFTHDYNTGVTDWSNQSVFTELEPQNRRQKENWDKNRKDVYDISITKFIKSLYNNTLNEDGFVLADLIFTANPGNPYSLSLLNRDDVLLTNPNNSIKSINLDRSVILICYGSQVTENDLRRLQTVRQDQEQPLAQTIPGTMPGSVQQERYRPPGADRIRSEGQISDLYLDGFGKIRNLIQGDSIRIFPDGTFTNPLSMGRVNNSPSLLGIGMRLPINYSSETSTINSVIVTDVFDFASIAQLFDDQLNAYPQEKIHLHTDRDFYVPGERIWFRAYIVDAATHREMSQSAYLYAELVDSRVSLVSRVMIRPENNMFHGHIFLSEIIPEGDYTLRAYTRYMENLGDDWFFKKNIRIGNLAATKQQLPDDNPVTPVVDDFDVTFYPEGGNLLEGVLWKVAFKALNKQGYSEKISGEIVDGNGAVIASIRTFHAGMGVFSFAPNPRMRYFLKCSNDSGLEKQFELPQSVSNAHALAISCENSDIEVRILKSAQSEEAGLYLLAHSRGEVFYFEALSNEAESIIFSAEDLPSGVIQFLLFDARMNPLSERLAFNKSNENASVDVQTDKAVYARREKVVSKLLLTNTAGNPLNGNISVAITDDADIEIDAQNSILASLLLSSELKGYIENPAWYLRDDEKSFIALDYLMLTHGWRRYNVPEIVKGNQELPQIAFQTSQQISGVVAESARQGLFSRRSEAETVISEVLMMASNGDFGMRTTDDRGVFVFSDFEYPDSTTYFLRILASVSTDSRNRGNAQTEIVVDTETFPNLVHAPQSPVWEFKEEIEESSDAFLAKAEGRARFDEDMWSLSLSELEITGRRVERTIETRQEFWANASSDEVIRVGERETSSALTVSDLIRQNAGAGVYVDNRGNISIRGADVGTEYKPLMLIDGISLGEEVFVDEVIRVNEIESIDIFKGVGAAAFGSRGAGGVISITTRSGAYISEENEEPDHVVFTPLGYQTPVEFYSPKYDTPEARRSAIPDYRTTIFWKPDIVVTDEGEAFFEFFTADFNTTYSVVIEGITDDGKIVRQVKKIRVE